MIRAKVDQQESGKRGTAFNPEGNRSPSPSSRRLVSARASPVLTSGEAGLTHQPFDRLDWRLWLSRITRNSPEEPSPGHPALRGGWGCWETENHGNFHTGK